MTFNEEAWRLEHQKREIRLFLSEMKRIDREQGRILEKEGWLYKETAERTVMFTFGEVTLVRRCYIKKGVRRYPVDEYLELEPYSRISKYLLYKLATTVVDLPCRKAALHFKELLYLNITKDMVANARKQATRLYAEKEEYRFFKEEEMIDKIKIKVLHIEGDGVLISTPDAENEVSKTDFAHFIIHEGVEMEYGKRGKTINKHEIWSDNNKDARDQVLDYLHNYYDISRDTLIITNSDMGHGYTPYVFEEIAKAFHCRHEHFWDRYHLNRLISDMMKNFPSVLEEKLFSAIEKYSKKSARTVLDTAESYIGEDDSDFEEKFKKFKNKLLNNFSYTKLPEQRGIKPGGIGVLESNHTKLCYRMKKQARRWSKVGALTMGKMIIDKAEGKLEELFYGGWREEYEKYKNMAGISAQNFLTKPNPNRGIRHVRQANKSGKRRY